MESELKKVVLIMVLALEMARKVVLLPCSLGQLLGAFPRPPPSPLTLVAVVPSFE